MKSIMIAVAVLPALILWIYTCKNDTQREPMPQMVKALLYGMGLVALAIPIEKAISYLLFGDVELETIRSSRPNHPKIHS